MFQVHLLDTLGKKKKKKKKPKYKEFSQESEETKNKWVYHSIVTYFRLPEKKENVRRAHKQNTVFVPYRIQFS